MKLICPCCGAVASIEGWAGDAAARNVIGIAMRMPAQVHGLVFPYLGLFRTGKGGLAWPRAQKLLLELEALIKPGTVRWDGGEERPAPPSLWARAMDAVLVRRPTGLGNHNYLRRAAWDMASPLAARAEREKIDSDRSRPPAQAASNPVVSPPPERTGAGAVMAPEDDPATEEERKEVQQMLAAFTSRLGGAP